MPKGSEYLVQCADCGSVFSPYLGSALWWKAKGHAAEGYLDAFRCSGAECGCVKEVKISDAPYRVFGYDDMCYDFDIPCDTFVEAVKAYRDNWFGVVFITGVSEPVRRKLRMML